MGIRTKGDVETPNRYLRGLPKARSSLSRLLVLWVVLIATFLAVYLLLTPARSPPPSRAPARYGMVPVEPRLAPPVPSDGPRDFGDNNFAIMTLALVFVVVFVALILTARRTKRRYLMRAEAWVLRDELDRAVVELRAFLSRPLDVLARYNGLVLLGACAEANGDFAEAEEIFQLTKSSLGRTAQGAGFLHAMATPNLAARRAFALAALGRLDEAEAELALTMRPDALPGTRALAVRARALLHAKRAEHRALLDLLASERIVLRNTLTFRNKTLLRVLEANAKRALEGAHRAAAPSGLSVDAELRAWIERALPEVAPMLGSP